MFSVNSPDVTYVYISGYEATLNKYFVITYVPDGTEGCEFAFYKFNSFVSNSIFTMD